MSSDFGIKKWPRGVRGDNGEAPPDDDGQDEAADYFASISHNQLTAIVGACVILMGSVFGGTVYTQSSSTGSQENTSAVKPLKK